VIGRCTVVHQCIYQELDFFDSHFEKNPALSKFQTLSSFTHYCDRKQALVAVPTVTWPRRVRGVSDTMDVSPQPRAQSQMSSADSPDSVRRPVARPMSAPPSRRKVMLSVSPERWRPNVAAAQTRRKHIHHRHVQHRSVPKQAGKRENWLQDAMAGDEGSRDDPWIARMARVRVSSLPLTSIRRNVLRRIINDSCMACRETFTSRLLAEARGEDGDWRTASRSTLNVLVRILIEAEHISDATRVLSDFPFLQRRLQLGALHEVLDDFDLIEAALEELVMRPLSSAEPRVGSHRGSDPDKLLVKPNQVLAEPYELRSAASSGALARRRFLQDLRSELDDTARSAQVESPARLMFVAPALLVADSACWQRTAVCVEVSMLPSRLAACGVWQPFHGAWELPLRKDGSNAGAPLLELCCASAPPEPSVGPPSTLPQALEES
jgi:hypothetical protein